MPPANNSLYFKVRIEPSGHELDVRPDETIIAAALRANLLLPHSCRRGSCGACKSELVYGTVDYGICNERALTRDERAAGRVLLCQARPLSDLVINARPLLLPAGITIKTLAARVVALNQVAHDVMELSIKLPHKEPFEFLAGQYVDILLSGNQQRSFSIANPPTPSNVLQLHIRHVPNGLFTPQVFNRLKEQDLLRIRGPLGSFFLREDRTSAARPTLVIAGGTGFAPIKAMVEAAIARNDTRPMHLYWGVRSRRDLYAHELASSWARMHTYIKYTPVLSDPRSEEAWDGRTGWVHEAAIEDYPDLSAHEVYASGPPPMINAIKQRFLVVGLLESRLYYDSFEFPNRG